MRERPSMCESFQYKLLPMAGTSWNFYHLWPFCLFGQVWKLSRLALFVHLSTTVAHTSAREALWFRQHFFLWHFCPTYVDVIFNLKIKNGGQFQTYVHWWGGGAGSPASQAEDPREDLRKGFLDNIFQVQLQHDRSDMYPKKVLSDC